MLSGETSENVIQKQPTVGFDAAMSCAKDFPLPLHARLQYVIFHRDDFYIVSFVTIDSDVTIEFSAKGNSAIVPQSDQVYDVHGEWIRDAKYGEQVRFTCLVPVHSTDVMTFLSSGIIRGIGPVTARHIYEKFGEETLHILDTTPEQLKDVRGIGAKTLAKIIESYQESKGLQDLVAELEGAALSLNQVYRIYKALGARSLQVIHENPYQLLFYVDGLGFKQIDEFALKLGVEKTSPNRILAGISYVLRESAFGGSTYLPMQEALASTSGLLNLDPETIKDCIDHTEHASIVVDSRLHRIAIRKLYEAESLIANQITRLEIKGTLIDYSLESGATDPIPYSKEQLLAVERAFTRPVSVITGYPGVGKTAVIRKILSIANAQGYSVVMASPTGKAAVRMEEVTNHEASTIHRLLGIQAGTDDMAEVQQLSPVDIVIIDESSMLDVTLAALLFSSIPNGTHVVLVGDPDQLPSVGPGNFLNDLILSDCVNVTRLTHIYRQGAGSTISRNAVHIMNDEEIESGDDFEIHDIPDEAGQLRLLKQIVASLDPKKSHILSPMKKGLIGVVNTNRELQPILNAPGAKTAGIDLTVRHFYQGDKVMQLVNDYERNIFNGQIGYIESLGLDGQSLIIDFDGQKVLYARTDLDEVDLAYVSTVHKFQGSECDTVVVLLNTTQMPMLQRKLFYTAVTRARQKVVLIAPRRAIRIAINNTTEQQRYTRLRSLLSTYNG